MHRSVANAAESTQSYDSFWSLLLPRSSSVALVCCYARSAYNARSCQLMPGQDMSISAAAHTHAFMSPLDLILLIYAGLHIAQMPQDGCLHATAS